MHTCPHLPRYWEDLNPEERTKVVKDRLKKYTQKVCVVCEGGQDREARTQCDVRKCGQRMGLGTP